LIFNSFVFLEFLVIFLLTWPFFRKTKLRYVYLITASCLFYGYAGWWFVPLLLATASVDFYVGNAIYKFPEKKKALLALSLVTNLSVLALFKYSAFATQIANSVLHRLGMPASLPVPHLVLPIGISFYTFQSLSYIFDIYRGKLKPTTHLLHFLSIVTLFPHLVAGPIVRVSHILPQIEKLKSPSGAMVWEGIQLIAFGLFKKMVLADNLSPYVDQIYSGQMPTNGAAYTLATIAFSFQIYYDFSGYTDIARGLARLLGIDFELNFNHPYCAIGISDFWTRWHISLSTWIRDYIYFPLGGSRVSPGMAHRNIWISMLLSGLWHGANWTYIFWGALNAFWSSLERITNWPQKISKSSLGQLAGILITFLIVTVSWIFFRAESMGQAFKVLSLVARPWSGLSQALSPASKFFLLAIAFAVLHEGYRAFTRVWPKLSIGQVPLSLQMVRAAVLFWACLYLAGPGKAFIYFQF